MSKLSAPERGLKPATTYSSQSESVGFLLEPTVKLDAMFTALSADLLSRLDRYRPSPGAEMQMVEAMKEFVRTYWNCFDRSLAPGHVTGSAWIVDETGSSALLTHHRKLNRWLQPGGHWEGDINVFATAKREAEEESGLTSLSPLSSEIFDVDIHLIPQRASEPEHLHFDVRFIFKADHHEPVKLSRESRDLAWKSMREILEMGDPSLIRMVEKTRTGNGTQEAQEAQK